MPGKPEKDCRAFYFKGGNAMDQEIKKAIWNALDNGHNNICCEVADVKNIILAFEHAAIYAEEQRNTLHKPPDWPCLFVKLGEVIEGIVKEADKLFDMVMQAAGINKETDKLFDTAMETSDKEESNVKRRVA